MAELIIVCGLMGSGKTTFAKEFMRLKGFEYVDFDQEFHKKFGGKGEEFLNMVVKILNKSKDQGFVIDNWFKWNRYWYKFDEDNTIEFIRKKTGREISFIYLFVPFKKSYRQYIEKHEREDTMSDVLQEFKKTMKKRQQNLLEKIERCLNGTH